MPFEEEVMDQEESAIGRVQPLSLRDSSTEIGTKRREAMLKKLVLIGALCTAMTVMGGVDANAFPPNLGGWSFTLGSVNANTLWLGCGAYAVNPTDIEITLSDIQLQLYPLNPAGNDGGIGVPYSLTDSVSGWDEAIAITRNGRYASTIVFTNSDFLSLVNTALLPNPNWTLDPDRVDVLHFKGLIQGFADVDTRCENLPDPGSDASCYPSSNGLAWEEEVAHVEVDCNLQNGTYFCTTQQDWDWSKKYPVFTAQ